MWRAPPGRRRSEVLRRYERCYGRPGEGMVRGLRQACMEIDGVDTWPAYFARLGLRVPGKAAMVARLRTAVRNSARKGYHGPGERPRKPRQARGVGRGRHGGAPGDYRPDFGRGGGGFGRGGGGEGGGRGGGGFGRGGGGF